MWVKNHNQRLFALDLGTTKFCLATLAPIPGQKHLRLETVSVPAGGMHRGMLSDIKEAKSALIGLLEAAEQQFNADIARVVVGIAGSHLNARLVSSALPLENESVSSRDIHNLIEKVETQFVLDGRELLHTVPLGYKVDTRETVDHPVGFSGKNLSGEFFQIDADRYYLKDVIELCNSVGLQVTRLYSEPFASASVTVPDDAKELGAAVADIGGGTTDGLVFQNGRPRAAFTVNVAGKLMTSDLAIGLNIDLKEAERVKIHFGIKTYADDEKLEILDIRGSLKQIGSMQVQQILTPRIQELLALLTRELSPFRGRLGAGIFLTGGGSGVQNIVEYCQSRLAIPVRSVSPALTQHSIIDANDGNAVQGYSKKFATVIGLLNLELNRIEEESRTRKNTWTNRYIGQFINWIKELS